MAESNRWKGDVALCPACQQPVGELIEGALIIANTVGLLRVTTLRCHHGDCRRVFTYRPRSDTFQKNKRIINNS